MEKVSKHRALEYLARGWSVIPLQPRGKTPLVAWKEYQSRHATEDEVVSWFTRHPDCNIGVVTGAISGITVLDLDSRDAEAAVLANCGELPPTPVCVTSRGKHVYFAYRAEAGLRTTAKVRGLVDLRHDGGFVVCAPSTHPSGAEYHWSTIQGCGFDAQLAPVPDALYWLLAAPAKTDLATRDANWKPRVTLEELTRKIPEGSRNTQLTRIAGHFFAEGLSEDQVLVQLLDTNQRLCEPPLSGEAIQLIVQSIARRDKAAASTSLRSAGFVSRSLDSVKTEEMHWLWQNYVPLGSITLFDGVAGVGKSTVTLDIAARVSTGRPMPDGTFNGIEGSVILVTVEDDLARTIKPRLEAANADLSRIHTFEGPACAKTGVATRLPAFPTDITRLEETIRQTGARLVIIDPLMAFLDSRLSAWKDQDVRAALAPLTRMAEVHNVAIIGIRHPTKNREASALDAGSGSVGIAASARAVFYLGEHRASGYSVFAPVKQNLSKGVRSLAFEVVSGPNDRPKVEWSGPTEITADELRPQSNPTKQKKDVAREFLRSMLASGPCDEAQIKEAAREVGVSDTTLKRAKKSEGVESRKKGFDGGWEWFIANETSRQHLTPLVSFADSPDSYQLKKEGAKDVKKTVHPLTGTVGENADSGGGGYANETGAFSRDDTHRVSGRTGAQD